MSKNQRPLECLLKPRFLAPTSSFRIQPAWGLRICISDQFLGDGDDVDLRTLVRTTSLLWVWAGMEHHWSRSSDPTWDILTEAKEYFLNNMVCARS